MNFISSTSISTALKRFTLALAMCAVSLCAYSQRNAQSVNEPYKYDLGLALGMSGYWGDLNSNLFNSPGVAATAMFHYRLDTRWLVRGSFTGASISGNNKKEKNVLPGGFYEFDAGFYALDARAEFNFFSYGIGETYKHLKTWTPYLALGAGAGMSTVNSKSYFSMTLPMSFGVKYKLKERVNVGAEWTFMKAFGDRLDGYSDLTGIKTDFIRSSDWVSTLQLYFTYEFGKRCETCNRND